MKYLCECDTTTCTRSVDIPLAEAERIHDLRLVLMVEGSVPSPGDVLVEQHDGYGLYKEAA